jgi:hypothetical protein
MRYDEGKKLSQEDVPQLQDNQTQGRAARDLQESEAQAAPGVEAGIEVFERSDQWRV